MRSAPDLALLPGVNFVGSKGQNGIFHGIINLIPPHTVFIEPFAGLATVARRKKPAAETIVIDLDRHPDLVLPGSARFVRGDGIEFLKSYPWTGREVVYCDPPYLPSTRRYRRYYANEMPADRHVVFLSVVLAIKAYVIVSGYHSPLYDETLSGWNLDEITAYTRNHQTRIECLWYNFPRPTVLHEYSAAGDGYRERLRIKRKARRWAERLKKQSPIERSALFSALIDVMGAGALRVALNQAAAAPAVIAGSGAVSSSRAGRHKPVLEIAGVDLGPAPEMACLEQSGR